MVLAFQRKPWLNWVVAFSFPMGFFFIAKLVTLSALLDSATDDADPPTSRVIAGISLGLLEDLLASTLLVASLVLTDIASLFASKFVLSCVGEHHHTMLLLKAVGHVIRFVAVFALVMLALLPFAADMAMARPRQARFSTEHTAGDEAAGQSHLAPATAIGTACFALVFTAMFVGILNLTYWWPSQEMAIKTELSTARYSTPTYLAIRFAAHNTPPTDVELGSPVRSDHGDTDPRHVTIVSAPTEPGDDDTVGFELSRVHDKPTQAVQAKYPPAETFLVAVALLGVFCLLLDVTLAISQTSSTTVASIALNATLNEIFRAVFGDCLKPGNC